MLDEVGNVPKVKLTASWLGYINFVECGKSPVAETRHACVCTPYIFNKYKGIFGLTGSVGGKAELNYLMHTYHAVKFDVPSAFCLTSLPALPSTLSARPPRMPSLSTLSTGPPSSPSLSAVLGPHSAPCATPFHA